MHQLVAIFEGKARSNLRSSKKREEVWMCIKVDGTSCTSDADDDSGASDDVTKMIV